MRILQICHKSPFPPAEGGPMAMKAIRDGLTDAGHHVHTFTLSTPKFRVEEALAAGISHFSHSYLDTSVHLWPAFRDLCLNRSHHVTRFYHRSIAQKLQQLLVDSEFDAVLIESIFMMPYFGLIRKHFKGPVILRAHNVEHVIWQRIASHEPNIVKKQYLRILARQLKRFEQNCFLQADAIAAISDIDAAAIRRLAPAADVETIPFAIEQNEISVAEKAFSGVFGHIGSMDWKPNAEGMDWFLQNVWPAVHRQHPESVFRLAGRNMPERFSNTEQPGVALSGTVDSAADFMQQLDMLVVPLLSGSGVRIKIAEALSLGVPVITTPVGAEGLLVKNGHDIIICENAAEMTDAIGRIFDSPQKLKQLAAGGRNTIREHHAPRVVTARLVSLIERKRKL